MKKEGLGFKQVACRQMFSSFCFPELQSHFENTDSTKQETDQEFGVEQKM